MLVPLHCPCRISCTPSLPHPIASSAVGHVSSSTGPYFPSPSSHTPSGGPQGLTSIADVGTMRAGREHGDGSCASFPSVLFTAHPSLPSTSRRRVVPFVSQLWAISARRLLPPFVFAYVLLYLHLRPRTPSSPPPLSPPPPAYPPCVLMWTTVPHELRSRSSSLRRRRSLAHFAHYSHFLLPGAPAPILYLTAPSLPPLSNSPRRRLPLPTSVLHATSPSLALISILLPTSTSQRSPRFSSSFSIYPLPHPPSSLPALLVSPPHPYPPLPAHLALPARAFHPPAHLLSPVSTQETPSDRNVTLGTTRASPVSRSFLVTESTRPPRQMLDVSARALPPSRPALSELPLSPFPQSMCSRFPLCALALAQRELYTLSPASSCLHSDFVLSASASPLVSLSPLPLLCSPLLPQPPPFFTSPLRNTFLTFIFNRRRSLVSPSLNPQLHPLRAPSSRKPPTPLPFLLPHPHLHLHLHPPTPGPRHRLSSLGLGFGFFMVRGSRAAATTPRALRSPMLSFQPSICSFVTTYHA
ncbi:hypothetical protein C8R44DRAFT_881801 [Mycena epipterygia]|nr:hypothetical protein C8R44DRAFT_881801 [Mycena epipterygia]